MGSFVQPKEVLVVTDLSVLPFAGESRNRVFGSAFWGVLADEFVDLVSLTLVAENEVEAVLLVIKIGHEL